MTYAAGARLGAQGVVAPRGAGGVGAAHRRRTVLTGLLLVAGLWPAACDTEDNAPRRVVAMETILNRQIEGLQDILAAARKGSLLPKDKLVVAVHEDVVRGLAQLALPRERIIDGKFRVRIEKIDVRFQDKWGSVRMDGRVGLAGESAEEVFADLALFGLLDAVEVDPRTGTLQGKVRLLGFELHRLDVHGSPLRARWLIESLAAAGAEKLSALAFPLTIPVHLESELTLNGLTEGAVRLKPARFPVKVTVAEVVAVSQKLWIALDIQSGPWRKLAAETAKEGGGGSP